MKKVIGLLLFCLLFFSACNFSVDVEDNTGEDKEQSENNSEEKEDLHLQVTKVDEDAGVSVENNEMYQMLDEFVQENPKFGVADDFSMQSVTLVTDTSDNQKMLFLGVNRLGAPVKNVTFNLSLGNTDGDMVWEDFPVILDEEVAGVLENNAALPIFLPITSQEQIELMNTISQENLYIEFKDFKYETVEQ